MLQQCGLQGAHACRKALLSEEKPRCRAEAHKDATRTAAYSTPQLRELKFDRPTMATQRLRARRSQPESHSQLHTASAIPLKACAQT